MVAKTSKSVTVAGFYNSFYILQWRSSPMLGVGKQAVAAINVLIGCYTFLTGLHVDQVRKSLDNIGKKISFFRSSVSLKRFIAQSLVYHSCTASRVTH